MYGYLAEMSIPLYLQRETYPVFVNLVLLAHSYTHIPIEQVVRMVLVY